MLHRHDRKAGIACDLVNWRHLPRELVERSLGSIPRRHLSAVFDKLSENLGTNKSGFPDLVLFPAQTGAAVAAGAAPPSDSSAGEVPGYELVEVKGPGDQLQTNQRRWLRFFGNHCIPYRVVRVHWRQQATGETGRGI
jgi:hypothetical protein